MEGKEMAQNELFAEIDRLKAENEIMLRELAEIGCPTGEFAPACGDNCEDCWQSWVTAKAEGK